jgi:predicted RND superfamily exporter protein
MPSVPAGRMQRFAEWLDRFRLLVLLVAAIVAVGSVYVARRITIRSDLTNLLPSSQRSVRDLKEIQRRARPFGTVQIVIEAPDPIQREQAATILADGIRRLDPSLVSQFSIDEGPLRRYVWEHRFLFAELADLQAARDALRDRIEHAKLAANPLYIDLDDGKPGSDRLDALEKKLADAEHDANQPAAWISKDGKVQLLVIQTAFSGSDADHAHRILASIRQLIAAVHRDVPAAEVGLAGNVVMTLYEHDSVLQGMAASAVITVLLCAGALLYYYRAGRLVIAMLLALAVGVAATFAMAWLMVGHLNVMTAFLFAIVVGNGINAGLILVARYTEDVRAGKDPRVAVGLAMAGALRGTFAATATAAIAYASLLVTDFRGFRHFGLIAGAGMTLTWVTTFTVLPALMFVIARGRPLRVGKAPAVGKVLARIFTHQRLRPLMIGGIVLTVVALLVAGRFVLGDPFLHDWRDLQSSTADIRRTRDVEAKIRTRLSTASVLSGQAYQIVIAVDRRDQVLPLVEDIRKTDAARPEKQRWTKDARSLDDLLPAQQPEKLAVLAEIRALIDGRDFQDALSADDKQRIAKLRPPEDLRLLGDDDVPADLAWPFIERDGSRGRLIVVRGASRFNSFNVDDRLAFAREVRHIALPQGAMVAGEPLVVADIITTMERDAPLMIIFALVGSILAVLVVLGLRRQAAITIACGLAGVVVMIAACSLAGLRVHFVDLIALPITIGIGVDYAVNLAARHLDDRDHDLPTLLQTTGAAVLLCSFTTSVGYSTLMLSANGGIRAFGLAALIGEVSCITMALVFGPAWLAWFGRRREALRDREML